MMLLILHCFLHALVLARAVQARASPTRYNLQARNGAEFPTGEFAHGNHEDKTLQAKPPEVEADPSGLVAAARFDHYYTEPTFRPAKVAVEYITDGKNKLAPGYYFIAPFACGTVGPQIVDQLGELIYWGTNEACGHQVKNFVPCVDLSGALSCLCWSEVNWDEYHHEYVINRVFDSTYTQIGSDYGAAEGSVYPNPHEFNMLPEGKSFVQVVYKIKLLDLTAYAINGEAWVQDGCFEEIKTETKKTLFSWCALDHFALDETYLYANIHGQENFTEGIAGLGTFRRSWDFAHINSVDKLPSGDYLVSSRHFNSIIKVAGSQHPTSAPGTVLWHLNGKSNDFNLADNFTFFRQHHARYLSSSGTTMLLSLFNNAFTVRNPEALEGHASRGQIIAVDEHEMTASLVHEYVHPYANHSWRDAVTLAGGSVDVHPALGNAVVGWGSLPDISEFSENGELLFHANLGNHTCNSYRTWKKPWVGRPSWPPKVVAFSRSCTSDEAKVVAYVSWNGATEVVAWRFHAGVTRHGPWLPVGTFPKQGFEMRVDLSVSTLLGTWFGSLPFLYVEALDARGNVIGQANTTTLLQPSQLELQEIVNAFKTDADTFQPSVDASGTCIMSFRSLAPSVALMAMLMLLLEAAGFAWNVVLLRWWRPNSRFGSLASVTDQLEFVGHSCAQGNGARRQLTQQQHQDEGINFDAVFYHSCKEPWSLADVT